jgi:quinol monooxygenase YgiN
MSLLVHYTLRSADDHAHQIAAMEALVAGLSAEGAAGTDGLQYTCFTTDDPTRFVGLLQFDSDTGKQTFLDSPAFATYRETVGPTFANPPQTTEISAFASTRS